MSSFEISRSVQVQAGPGVVHALINDFRRWQAWSPWEGMDPSLNRKYTGPEEGVGATYAWVGNRKAGAGQMKITASSPERIDVALDFVKPFKANNAVHFDLVPSAAGTAVNWTMSGERSGLASFFAKVVPMDKMIAKDFDKGLAQLKALAERETPQQDSPQAPE